MKKYLTAILLIIATSASAQTSSYSTMPWGINKSVSPYKFGYNNNSVWKDLGTISSAGVWAIPSSNITFLQAGTGAVSVTVESRLRDVVSVVDFGASCNDANDDTAAFQAAINAGRLVVVPFENCTSYYNISSTLSVPVSRTIQGAGNVTNAPTGIRATANIDIFTQAGDSVTYQNLNILHNGNGRVFNINSRSYSNILDNIVTVAAGTTGDIIFYTGSINNIANNRIQNSRASGYWAIKIDSVSGAPLPPINNTITGNYIGSGGAGTGDGIYIAGASANRPEGFLIIGNLLITSGRYIKIDSVLTVRISNNGFDGGLGMVLSEAGQGIEDVEVSDNYFSGTADATNSVCLAHVKSTTTGSIDIRVTGNYFHNCGYGVNFRSTASGVTVTNNQFRSIAQVAAGFDATKNVIFNGNFMGSVVGNIVVVEGLGGGPFIITGDIFETGKVYSVTVTDRSKLIWANNYGLPTP